MQQPSVARITAALTVAIGAVSSAALVILLAEPLQPLVIATGRVAVTGVAMGLIAWRAVPAVLVVLRRDPRVAARVVLAAALLALHFGAWIASLSMTSVLRSVTLVATQPLFAGLLGLAIGDRAPGRLYFGALVAAVGTVVMLDPTALGDRGGALVGDALALLAAAAAAGYLVIGRSLRGTLNLRGYLACLHLTAAAMLALVAVVSGATWWPAAAQWSDLACLAYLGLVPGVVGHGLLNWAVRHVPVHVVALAVLLEPLGATALAAVVLGYGVGAWEAAGAAIILLGVGTGLPRAR